MGMFLKLFRTHFVSDDPNSWETQIERNLGPQIPEPNRQIQGGQRGQMWPAGVPPQNGPNQLNGLNQNGQRGQRGMGGQAGGGQRGQPFVGTVPIQPQVGQQGMMPGSPTLQRT